MTDTTDTNAQAIDIDEISLPSVHAWSWTTPDDELGPIDHQIIWLHDTIGLFFSVKSPHTGKWSSIKIDSPSRFGLLEPKLNQARAAAHNFIFDREPGEGPEEMD